MDVAIRDAMLPELEGREFFRRLGEVEVSSLEIDVLPDGQTPWIRDEGGAAHSIKDMPAVKRLKRRLDDEGLRVGALLVSTDFSSPQANEHVEWAVKTVWAARELGAPVIRIDPLSRDKSVSGPAA